MDREVRKPIIVIFLIGILVLIVGILIYLSIQHLERGLDVGANIESIEIDDNYVYITLNGGANDKEIERVKFIFTDSNGVKHYYSTTEGVENLSQFYKKSIFNLFKKPEFEGIYKYIIDSNEFGLKNFDSIYKIEVVFDYKKEGLDIDKDVSLDEESALIIGRKRGDGDLVTLPIPFVLTSTGDGSVVSTLTVTVSEDTEFTLDGTARFYSDAGGTADESSSWTVTTGGARTRYIRVPTGTSNMNISTNTITSWGAWVSGTNAASLGGNISKLTALTYLNVAGNNTLSGSVAALTSLTYLDVRGSNTLSGSIAGLTSLTVLSVYGSNTVSGSIAGLTSLTVLSAHGSNTISGSVAGLTSLIQITGSGSIAITGSIDALTSLTYIDLYGSNTLSGDISLVSDGLTYCIIAGDNQMVNYTTGGDWSSIGDQADIAIEPAGGYGLSSSEVDDFIIEVESTRATDRHLHLSLTGSNAPRTSASDAAVAAIIADGGTVTTN